MKAKLRVAKDSNNTSDDFYQKILESLESASRHLVETAAAIPHPRKSGKELLKELNAETERLFEERIVDQNRLTDIFFDANNKTRKHGSRAKARIINVDGKAFQVHPNTHFATLINSTN